MNIVKINKKEHNNKSDIRKKMIDKLNHCDEAVLVSIKDGKFEVQLLDITEVELIALLEQVKFSCLIIQMDNGY